MNSAIFIDANIPIYAFGREHAYKEPCAQILFMAAEQPRLFVTDAEVLQELLHRYLTSDRWALGKEIIRGFAEVMHSRIEPIHGEDVQLAASLADHHPRMSSRDLLHAAVMQRLGSNRVVTADTDFDSLPGVTRLDPADVADWGTGLG